MTVPSTQMQSSNPVLTKTKRSRLFLLQQSGLFLVVILPPCFTLYAAFVLTHGALSWGYPLAAILLASLVNLGTTAGYHRMLTHQSFQAHSAVQYTLLSLGAIGGMSSPVTWAYNHLHHHSHSDTVHDLHSPSTPRFARWRFPRVWQWLDSHMGWLFRDLPVTVSARARQVTNTPAARFVHRTCNLWLAAGLLVPLCFGWNAFIWCGAVRLFLNHHITWSVNSICHMWGQQPFPNTKDKSKNNTLVGFLALGEGWHNNHHFRPTSARHGLLPRQLDLTYAVICLLERCKLAWNVQRYKQCPGCQDWHAVKLDKDVFCTKCQKRNQTGYPSLETFPHPD